MREKEEYPAPGRELDALVAERVMQDAGRTEWYASRDGGKSSMLHSDDKWIFREQVEDFVKENPIICGARVTLWSVVWHRHYSTDDAEAMSVVMKLRDALPSMIWQTGMLHPDPSKFAWSVEFRRQEVWAAHESFAAAVCLAALKAVAKRGLA